jgi:hypothetical protein
MISITCTNCDSVLTIDDAFAGGVCRCQFCGTIQTVPAKSRSALQPAAASKTLYQKSTPPPTNAPARVEAPGTGLEDLGSSSGTGLVGSHLETDSAPTTTAEPPPVPKPGQSQPMRMSVIVVCAAVVVMVGLVAALLVFRGSHSSSTSSSGTGSTAGVAGADFCGVPINAVSVIFLLDRGNSINDSFDALKAAAYKSLKQLGPDRKFQIIFWDRESGSAEFPAGGMRNATAGAIEDCQRDFQDVVAGGSTHLGGALREAIDRKPQLIMIATAKPQLDDDDAAALTASVMANVRVDFIQIGSPSTTAAVTEVTHSTGGHLKNLTTAELRDFSK